MSYVDAAEPTCSARRDPVELLIEPGFVHHPAVSLPRFASNSIVATVGSCTMAEIRTSADVRLVARRQARAMVPGGRSPGHLDLWWNFVSSPRDRIAGDPEFVPWPDHR